MGKELVNKREVGDSVERILKVKKDCADIVFPVQVVSNVLIGSKQLQRGRMIRVKAKLGLADQIVGVAIVGEPAINKGFK